MTKTELFNEWQDAMYIAHDKDGNRIRRFTLVREMGTGVAYTDNRTNEDGSLYDPGEHFVSTEHMQSDINFERSCKAMIR